VTKGLWILQNSTKYKSLQFNWELLLGTIWSIVELSKAASSSAHLECEHGFISPVFLSRLTKATPHPVRERQLICNTLLISKSNAIHNDDDE
jgi:hypothetical protein